MSDWRRRRRRREKDSLAGEIQRRIEVDRLTVTGGDRAKLGIELVC